ncbi:MAG: DUF308 domain-containing protein [Cyclobacteriaceae bacterium]|jgi:uncharacterized membrane protein HdeD (DUF308 family)
MLTIKGLITFVFGLITISAPISVLPIVSQIFGLLIILSGISLTLLSFKVKDRDRNWRFTEGFIDLIIGLIIISFSGMTSSIFLSLTAIWISFMGILQISNGYRLRGLFNHYWILIFNGLLAIAFATIIFTHSYHGIMTLVILIGLQASVFGSFMTIISMYIRKILNDIDTEIPHKAGEEANQELSYY